jgi:hypothetical protein
MSINWRSTSIVIIFLAFSSGLFASLGRPEPAPITSSALHGEFMPQAAAGYTGHHHHVLRAPRSHIAHPVKRGVFRRVPMPRQKAAR